MKKQINIEENELRQLCQSCNGRIERNPRGKRGAGEFGGKICDG